MITVDFNRLNIRPGHTILDIGCGSGRHTCGAFRFEDVCVVGADLNADDLKSARDRLEFHVRLGEHGESSRWALCASDITRLPFDDASFNLVICSEVLEHIPDQRQAVREVIRVLKPGGDLAVSVPRYFPERICWMLSDDYFNANQGHVRIYTKQELVSLLESEGARYLTSSFAHSLHSPFWWLKCLVGPAREDSIPVNLYHRFLTWDIMEKPRVTRLLDRLLNPIMGKSLVLYLKKKS